MKRIALVACVALSCWLQVASAAAVADTDSVTVATFAGSGAMGIADGDVATASFQIPDGLAAASDGTLYVADAASQRIREIFAGKVTTIAGSGDAGALGFAAPAGYRDGPALAAQFSAPRGLAIARDGSIYVADSGNRAIRRIQNGVVSTVVGKPDASPHPKAVDGDATAARLVRPMSLAFDASGRLWIADFGGGLRCWERGMLSTVKLKPDATSALSVSVQPDDGTVLIATATFVYEYASNTEVGVPFPMDGTSEFNAPIGTPNQIAGIGNGQALFTDDLESNVRYLRFALPPYIASPYSTVIAGGSLVRHSDNIGFADGAAPDARFALPSGVAVVGNRAFVADSGNRRIRTFNVPQFRLPEVGRNSRYAYDSSRYEVALVGPSWMWFDSHDGDSMCAHVEQQLDATAKLGKPARCHTVRIDAAKIPATEDYIAANLAFRHVDEIVLSIEPEFALAFDAGGTQTSLEAFRASIVRLLAAIAPSEAHFTIFWQYPNSSISNREELWDADIRPDVLGTVDPDAYFTTVRPLETALFRSLDGLGVGQCDEYDRAVAYERGDGAPLFLPDNGHPTARGNIFFGTVLGDCLVQQLPPAPR